MFNESCKKSIYLGSHLLFLRPINYRSYTQQVDIGLEVVTFFYPLIFYR